MSVFFLYVHYQHHVLETLPTCLRLIEEAIAEPQTLPGQRYWKRGSNALYDKAKMQSRKSLAEKLVEILGESPRFGLQGKLLCVRERCLQVILIASVRTVILVDKT